MIFLRDLMNQRIERSDLKFEPIPNKTHGDLMTIGEFIDHVHSGLFIDYDGHGNYAYYDKCSNAVIIPSDVKKNLVDLNFTHVVWYNR